MAPYSSSGWIEYTIGVIKKDWNIFYDGFTPYKEYAEKYVLENNLL